MNREQFFVIVITAALSGWTATALFYAVMSGCFGVRGRPGRQGPRGYPGPPGMTGASGKDCECKCGGSQVSAESLYYLSQTTQNERTT